MLVKNISFVRPNLLKQLMFSLSWKCTVVLATCKNLLSLMDSS